MGLSKKTSYVTYREIMSQGETLASILKRLGPQPDFPVSRPDVLFTGCGSSLFLSEFAAHVWRRRAGLNCQAVPASEVLLYPEVYLRRERPTVVFALSRTGDTTETRRAAELIINRYGFPVYGVTCYEDSPLARLGNEALVFPEVQEESVVMTRAFTGILGAFLKWAEAEPGLDELPQLIPRSLEANERGVEELAGENFRDVVFLGSGPFRPLAQEAMLKVKEMTGQATLAWQTFEFRHGPKAILGSDALVWIFAGREDFSLLPEVLREFRALEARLCLAGNLLPPELVGLADVSFSLDWTLERSETEALGLIHLPQLYAFFRSVRLGNNPDRPRKLSRVVRLEGDG